MIIKKFVVKVGSVCTLKCEKCGEFNPYYEAKGLSFSVDANMLIDDMYKVVNAVDRIEILHIAGGEALLHKDLNLFLEKMSESDKIESIELVSNGTVIPNKEILKILEGKEKNKIKLLISDYSKSGVRNQKVLEFLKNSNVNYVLMKDMIWKDKSDVSNKNFDNTKLEYIADNCKTYREKGYFTLINGIVSAHCPTAGSLMYYLGLYDRFDTQWFDLRNTKDTEVCDKLKNLDEQKILNVCNYCTPSYEAKDIPAGIQINNIADADNLLNLDDILKTGLPVYMLGCKSKTSFELIELMNSKNKRFDDVFDYRWQEINENINYAEVKEVYDSINIKIKPIPCNYDSIEQGIIILAMEERYQHKWFKDISESKHKIIDGYDLVFNKEYSECIKYGGPHKCGLEICRKCRASFRSCPVRRDYYEKILGEKRNKVLRHVAYKLGYICNLKCEYCCEYIPLFKPHHKRSFDWKQAMQDIRKLSDSFEYINCLSFSGGDVMLNHDLCYIIDEVSQIKNIGYMYILSNGTYIPHKDILDSMERNNDRINLVINNYELNNGANNIVDEMKKRNVNCRVRDNAGWYNLNNICFRNRSVNELKHIYEHCSFDNNTSNHYYVVIDGKLNMRCGVANGLLFYLDKYDTNVSDYVDIRNYSENDLPKEIEKLEDKGYLDICNYCESCSVETRDLKAAKNQRG